MPASLRIEFSPSTSTDVVAYRLYYDLDEQLGYESPSFRFAVEDLMINNGGNYEVDLGPLLEPENLDGVYDIGVVAIDDAGNESSPMTVLENVPLDFVAPLAPAYIGLVG